ncbi:MAG: glycine zipper 2TM domain-containing protein [Gammaproteobacteria bacterium]|jgi:uncharacterized protein YcfJ|nr:glycine zipper 2TM domain-containing protein [Gammaproteobacteria bacterium]MDC0464080.1 glycine zipper 2TM domain-containing protein [Pseudomonadales bacterium]
MKIATMFLLSSLAPTALASSVAFEDAIVLSAVPVFEQVAIQTPSQACWVERVAVRRNRDHGVGLVVGGVVGGAIGHAVGHKKRNKQVGAILGSVLGATVGNAMAKNRHVPPRYQDREVCETHHTARIEERLLGYDVSYEYNGQVYNVRMGSDPGAQVRLRVSHRPVG